LPRPLTPERGGSRPPAIPELEVLARTLWGEARGEPVRGLEAIAAVVVNRVAAARAGRCRWWGQSIQEVCLAPGQFPCWARTDPNRRLLLAVDASDPVFATCRRIARLALAGTLADRTSGATHYHADSVFPSWAVGHLPCAEIGRHLFYKLPLDATPHKDEPRAGADVPGVAPAAAVR